MWPDGRTQCGLFKVQVGPTMPETFSNRDGIDTSQEIPTRSIRSGSAPREAPFKDGCEVLDRLSRQVRERTAHDPRRFALADASCDACSLEARTAHWRSCSTMMDLIRAALSGSGPPTCALRLRPSTSSTKQRLASSSGVRSDTMLFSTDQTVHEQASTSKPLNAV